MDNKSPKILIISSCGLTQGPAIIAGQYYDAFCRQGIETDLLLKYPEPGHPEYLYVVDNDFEKSFFFRLRLKYLWLRYYKWKPVDLRNTFFYTKEKYPPIPSRYVIKKINKDYDLVLIVFWQGLLSFETIKRIHNKLHCQIHFLGVDYSQMSGGCHFPGNCAQYMTGCGKCPAFLSTNKNDFTSWNVKYREKVYKKVKPVVYGNLYMHQFYKKSYLLKNVACELIPSPIIDTDLFLPLDSNSLREKYQIPIEKKHILFFACQNLNDSRKGIPYLLEAFSILSKQLKEETKSILVLMAGNGYEQIKEQIPFDSKSCGYVSMETLPELFSISKCFICTSVNDAGPMMVNQSICCGTPVVGFEMGAVLQVIKDKGTGISVPLKDAIQLAEGINRMLKMPKEEYDKMCETCRSVALQTSSYLSHVNRILSIYNKYQKNNTNISYVD